MPAEEWDKYWVKKDTISNVIFSEIAKFYRLYIISNIVDFFFSKYYKKGSLLLHAGCGSGKVDIKVKDKVDLISLDISKEALKINNTSNYLIQGNIFKLPIKANTLDGVYNLGVMEHFSEEDIVSILKEFRKAIKDNGKILLFWPPVFGLSEIFLKIVHFIANNVLRKRLYLYTEEITPIRSLPHVEKIYKKADLKLVEYYFGIRDLFTHVVIVLEKNER